MNDTAKIPPGAYLVVDYLADLALGDDTRRGLFSKWASIKHEAVWRSYVEAWPDQDPVMMALRELALCTLAGARVFDGQLQGEDAVEEAERWLKEMQERREGDE
jgi:hypothetical protein